MKKALIRCDVGADGRWRLGGAGAGLEAPGARQGLHCRRAVGARHRGTARRGRRREGRQPRRGALLARHSQYQVGDHVDAIQTIARLERLFAKSRWVRPARSLRVEIAQRLRRDDVLWVLATPPPPPPRRRCARRGPGPRAAPPRAGRAARRRRPRPRRRRRHGVRPVAATGGHEQRLRRPGRRRLRPRPC